MTTASTWKYLENFEFQGERKERLIDKQRTQRYRGMEKVNNLNRLIRNKKGCCKQPRAQRKAGEIVETQRNLIKTGETKIWVMKREGFQRWVFNIIGFGKKELENCSCWISKNWLIRIFLSIFSLSRFFISLSLSSFHVCPCLFRYCSSAPDTLQLN